ncbi:mucin-5AC-like [Anopheles merus]|uniref:mucin-5AC-like n=1 Tax=Anopheles merus TaxID=30066 RepID=UPI001BE41516|nr:mucin-5AC-like [Anopheles merus]
MSMPTKQARPEDPDDVGMFCSEEVVRKPTCVQVLPVVSTVENQLTTSSAASYTLTSSGGNVSANTFHTAPNEQPPISSVPSSALNVSDDVAAALARLSRNVTCVAMQQPNTSSTMMPAGTVVCPGRQQIPSSSLVMASSSPDSVVVSRPPGCVVHAGAQRLPSAATVGTASSGVVAAVHAEGQRLPSAATVVPASRSVVAAAGGQRLPFRSTNATSSGVVVAARPPGRVVHAREQRLPSAATVGTASSGDVAAVHAEGQRLPSAATVVPASRSVVAAAGGQRLPFDQQTQLPVVLMLLQHVRQEVWYTLEDNGCRRLQRW